MAIELAAAYISILPSTDKLAPAIRAELRSVQGEATRQGRNAGNKFGSGFKATLGRYAKRGLLAGAVGGSLLGGAGLKTAAELEQSKIGFETMLGSAKKAENFLDKIKATAAKTPFELPGLTQASQKLLAFGFRVKDVIPTLTTLGDAASGLGVGQEGLDRIILSVGQIQAKGKVQSDELLQLTENGIPALKILANGFKVSTAEMQTMVTKGLVPANKAIPLLLKGLKNGTKGAAGETAKFGGLMEKQSQSLTGLWSTLHDTVLVGMAGAIEPLLPTIKEGLTLGIERLGPALNNASKGVAHFVQEMKDGEGTGGAVADTLKAIYTTGKGTAEVFQSLPGPVKKFGIEALLAFYAVSKLRGVLSDTGSSIGTFVEGLRNAETRSAKLNAAARNLAGTGGLVLLSNGLHQADESARTFQTTLGGALLGFSVGGPMGAAVGAFAGFTASVVKGNDRQAAAFNASKSVADAYAGSLDAVTAKLTANTQATVVNSLQKNHPGAVAAAQTLGISAEVLARALSGGEKAQKRLNKAMREGLLSGKMVTAQNGGQARAYDVLSEALHGTVQETADGIRHQKGLLETFAESRKEAREQAATARTLSKALKGVPTGVVTKFVQDGGPQSLDAVETLIDRYHRTPKQVRTLVKALGLDVSNREMRILINQGRTLDQMRVAMKVAADTSKARQETADLLSWIRGLTVSIPVTTTTHATSVTDLLTPGTIPKKRRRAGGGSVLGGTTYLVGEKGPELFTAPQTGRIVPNHALRSSPRQIAAHTPTTQTRGELTITNWHKGQGYFRQIAEDTYDGNDAFAGTVGRMG